MCVCVRAGDLVMIAATEVSSERIPYESMPILTGVFMASWLFAAAALGDYKGDPPTTDNWYVRLFTTSTSQLRHLCVTCV